MTPIIKLEIESMKAAIVHAFNERILNLSSEVQHALDCACTPENIQSHVDEVVGRVVKEAVQESVKRWWLVSAEGRKLIDEAVAKKMDEEAKWYREAHQ